MIHRSSAASNRSTPATARTLPTTLALLLVLLVGPLLSACGERPATAQADNDEQIVTAQQDQEAPEAASTNNLASSGQGIDAQAGHDPHAAHGAQQHAEPLAAAPLPGTSLFHLTTAFTDQHGQPVTLGDLRGAPSVVVMFYGDCDTACPLLVRSAEEIERALPPELRSATNFVMVSFDTARDTPERLLAYAQEKDLDRDGWHWLVGSQFQTRQLATLLGVQYRDAGNGVFAHSNVVTVLDAEGVPTARLEGLGVPLGPAVAAVRASAALN